MSGSSDDEATIAREDDDPSQQASELKLLEQEKDQTFEDLLSELPEEYLSTLRSQVGL